MTNALPQFEFVDVPKRKSRWVGPVIVLVIIVSLLTAAFFVVDNFARGYAANLIETKVRSSLALPKSTPVHVTIGGTSVLLQLAGGKFDQVDIAIDALSVGDLSGDAVLTARGIPVDQSKPIDNAHLVFTANQEQLQKLLVGIKDVPVSTVAVKSGSVQLGTTITALGLSVPVGIALTPAAVDGQLALTPTSFDVGGKTLTTAEVASTLGPVGGALVTTRQICVASLLPKDFVLDSIAVKGESLSLGVTARSIVLNSQLLSTKGVCP
ncbi:DUF2993 domain-containing protein [Glaciihabitans sp. UYNi722]|uniref:LmeA family phospholipid-binding protein n=1 Tax=Glaciihabitans sp. UYNi722 TaxID=3156344 RepID=UPI0033920183